MKILNTKSKGFTLVEMLVVLAVISILIVVVVYSAKQYIGKGKDAAVKGNLVVLITAGELWYDKNSNSYSGFCSSDVALRSMSEVPSAESEKFCNVKAGSKAWSACAREFVDDTLAFCVDSKGNQEQINYATYCNTNLTNCCVTGTTNCIP